MESIVLGDTIILCRGYSSRIYFHGMLEVDIVI